MGASILNNIIFSIEGSSTGRSRVKSERTGRALPAAVPQGEYEPSLFYVDWGYVPHYGRDDFVPPPFSISDLDVAIGKFYEDTGDNKAAREAYISALDINPHLEEIQEKLGNI